ncbi:hypothetical protein C8Q77DRAFT_1093378 [Trametes polyzona]|nr:hypothetical protein C8Q77DRAFT_1093378 [Trametes polyzona]
MGLTPKESEDLDFGVGFGLFGLLLLAALDQYFGGKALRVITAPTRALLVRLHILHPTSRRQFQGPLSGVALPITSRSEPLSQTTRPKPAIASTTRYHEQLDTGSLDDPVTVPPRKLQRPRKPILDLHTNQTLPTYEPAPNRPERPPPNSESLQLPRRAPSTKPSPAPPRPVRVAPPPQDPRRPFADPSRLGGNWRPAPSSYTYRSASHRGMMPNHPSSSYHNSTPAWAPAPVASSSRSRVEPSPPPSAYYQPGRPVRGYYRLDADGPNVVRDEGSQPVAQPSSSTHGQRSAPRTYHQTGRARYPRVSR